MDQHTIISRELLPTFICSKQNCTANALKHKPVDRRHVTRPELDRASFCEKHARGKRTYDLLHSLKLIITYARGVTNWLKRTGKKIHIIMTPGDETTLLCSDLTCINTASHTTMCNNQKITLHRLQQTACCHDHIGDKEVATIFYVFRKGRTQRDIAIRANWQKKRYQKNTKTHKGTKQEDDNTIYCCDSMCLKRATHTKICDAQKVTIDTLQKTSYCTNHAEGKEVKTLSYIFSRAGGKKAVIARTDWRKNHDRLRQYT